MRKHRIKEMRKFYKKEIEKAFNDLKTPGKRYKQIPNLLSSMRLCAPFFILPAAFLGNVPIAIGLIIFFSITDLLDGKIARRYKLVSNLGVDLDAACDKVFVSTLLLAASFINPILLINFVWEVVIARINFISKLENKKTKASMVGKIKMACLYTLIICAFLEKHYEVTILFYTLFAVTTTLQGIAASGYLVEYKEKKVTVSQ